MSKISNFENFDVNEAIVVAGFGQTGIQQFGLGGGRPESGYSMTPVVGVVESCSNHLAEQANMYETNDNDDHTAESYLKEAKKHVNESIDKAYESYKATNEGMSKSAIKKMIKVIDKQIDTETGGDGEALDNETLQALEKERERLSAMNEAMVQVAGKDKPSGAKVLATVIVDHLIDKKIVTRAGEKKLTTEIQDLIIKSTF
tara:strand:+ start:326 stop:931 length:606 start_codon:yes stop_codon:yes gene_type:complete